MSKTTKIIAALGVVAGLGVAALPAFTYAESTTGEVEVQVEVLPAISMTISGNNDGSTPEHTSAINYTVVTPNPDQQDPQNPHDLGWYEIDADDGWVVTDDQTVDSEKTYYVQETITRRNVNSFNPAGMAEKQIDNHTNPATSITGTSSSYAALLPNAVIEGDISAQSPVNSFGSIITVYTNSNGGYTLSVADKDTNTSLMHTTGKYSIPTGAEAVAAGTAKWNFDSTPGADSSFAAKTAQAMPASNGTAVDINQTDTKTTNGSTTKVDYNVATSADQATGIYSDIIVYTATTR